MIKKKLNPWIKTVLLIFATLVFLFLVVNIFLVITTRHNREFVVPDFTSMSVPDAREIAHKAHLRLEVTDSVYIRGFGRGLISRQNPEAGSNVKKNRRILLTINSISPQIVEVPSLIGFSLRQAKTELLSCGLTIGKLIYVSDLATNNVLAQKYLGEDIEAGSKLESESPIDLILGLNQRDNITFVPDVRGYKYLTAKDMMYDNSLNISKIVFDETVVNYSDSLEAVVFKQYPAPSDSIHYSLGYPTHLYFTKNQEKVINPYAFE